MKEQQNDDTLLLLRDSLGEIHGRMCMFADYIDLLTDRLEEVTKNGWQKNMIHKIEQANGELTGELQDMAYILDNPDDPQQKKRGEEHAE